MAIPTALFPRTLRKQHTYILAPPPTSAVATCTVLQSYAAFMVAHDNSQMAIAAAKRRARKMSSQLRKMSSPLRAYVTCDLYEGVRAAGDFRCHDGAEDFMR